jgi:ABC-type antimicrobial peptide transport system permease subunit
MKAFDLLGMCLRNLARRKFRTFLTVTGVVIGTSAIVVMISLGVGIAEAQDAMFEGFGDLTIINVYSQGSSTESALDDTAVDSISAMSGVVVATPFMQYQPDNGYMRITAGRKDRYETGGYMIYGVKPESLTLLGYEIAEGSFLGETDTGRKIAMISGPRFVYDFYDTKRRGQNAYTDWWADPRPDPFFDPLEEENYNLVIDYFGDSDATEPPQTRFEVQMVGLIDATEEDYEKMSSAFISIDDMKALQAKFERDNGIRKDRDEVEQYQNVKVKVEDVELVSEVQAQIEEMGFYCDSMQQWRDQLQESTQQIQLILAVLGGVSLFVAAISITNTMIMSVYERTREIGVMKVLGCLVGNIRTIFLMEAGLIGFLGGVIGNLFSFLLSFLLNTFGGTLGQALGIGLQEGSSISVIPLWLLLLGLAFATMIGLVSGFYPANRAVKISALEAIRQE